MTECPGYDPAKADPNDQSINDHVSVASDLDWHLNPVHPHAFCGGCGVDTEDCHPGVCCSEERDRMRMLDSVCGYCQTRYETGQILHRTAVLP